MTKLRDVEAVRCLAGRLGVMEIGFAVPQWTPRQRPPATPMVGQWCSVVPLDPAAHAEQLFTNDRDKAAARWTYLPYEPPVTVDEYRSWMAATCASADPMFHTILAADGEPIGLASYLRIDPAMGSIEVGHINFSSRLQRTPAATEAMYLMARRVFDELGYRRYEWKCDSLNEPSHRAAERLGFTFEGRFRQAAVYKQRNRDTDWFSIIDSEWPALRERFERWLSPSNFDADGRQRASLATV